MALEAVRLAFGQRCLPVSATGQQATAAKPDLSSAVMVLRCGCGRKVAVNAAMALARPGRLIQQCCCGEVVWPPRDGLGAKLPRGATSELLRSTLGLQPEIVESEKK
jgi:hypothetical protein